MALPDGLLNDVKNYLDITWTDESTDKKVTGIIERGMNFLSRKSGKELDFIIEGLPKELLLEYCRYARNGILNEFLVNFIPFLEDLRGGAYGQSTDV